MNTWQDVIYRSVLEYDLKQDGVAADRATKDFEGDQDDNFSEQAQESGEAIAGQSV